MGDGWWCDGWVGDGWWCVGWLGHGPGTRGASLDLEESSWGQGAAVNAQETKPS